MPGLPVTAAPALPRRSATAAGTARGRNSARDWRAAQRRPRRGSDRASHSRPPCRRSPRGCPAPRRRQLPGDDTGQITRHGSARSAHRAGREWRRRAASVPDQRQRAAVARPIDGGRPDDDGIERCRMRVPPPLRPPACWRHRARAAARAPQATRHGRSGACPRQRRGSASASRALRVDAEIAIAAPAPRGRRRGGRRHRRPSTSCASAAASARSPCTVSTASGRPALLRAAHQRPQAMALAQQFGHGMATGKARGTGDGDDPAHGVRSARTAAARLRARLRGRPASAPATGRSLRRSRPTGTSAWRRRATACPTR